MKKTFAEQKPKKGQIIVFKVNDGRYPEIAVYEISSEGVESVYIPANDDIELPSRVDWWCEIPE
jgi:hypothetical protein